MTASTLTHDQVAGTDAGAGSLPPQSALTWPAHVVQWFRMLREQQRNIAALHALDDRLLKDIGIDRSEITSAVRGGRHR